VKDDNTISNEKIQGKKYRAVRFPTCSIFVIKAVLIPFVLRRREDMYRMYGLANLY
jgi:hypothetical protein